MFCEPDKIVASYDERRATCILLGVGRVCPSISMSSQLTSDSFCCAGWGTIISYGSIHCEFSSSKSGVLIRLTPDRDRHSACLDSIRPFPPFTRRLRHHLSCILRRNGVYLGQRVRGDIRCVPCRGLMQDDTLTRATETIFPSPVVVRICYTVIPEWLVRLV